MIQTIKLKASELSKSSKLSLVKVVKLISLHTYFWLCLFQVGKTLKEINSLGVKCAFCNGSFDLCLSVLFDISLRDTLGGNLF